MKAKRTTRADLEAARCSNPQCTHDDCILYFHARCHPHGGIQARYEKESREMVIGNDPGGMVMPVPVRIGGTQ